MSVRALTARVCCLQLLSSIYANKVTAYLNGHDHSMTVGNPQQANVSPGVRLLLAQSKRWHAITPFCLRIAYQPNLRGIRFVILAEIGLQALLSSGDAGCGSVQHAAWHMQME